MEQNKKHLTLKDLFNTSDLQNTLFASLLGDNNGNYNVFRVVRGGNAPLLTQRIYGYDK
jgi:hypothetical protein